MYGIQCYYFFFKSILSIINSVSRDTQTIFNYFYLQTLKMRKNLIHSNFITAQFYLLSHGVLISTVFISEKEWRLKGVKSKTRDAGGQVSRRHKRNSNPYLLTMASTNKYINQVLQKQLPLISEVTLVPTKITHFRYENIGKSSKKIHKEMQSVPKCTNHPIFFENFFLFEQWSVL